MADAHTRGRGNPEGRFAIGVFRTTPSYLERHPAQFLRALRRGIEKGPIIVRIFQSTIAVGSSSRRQGPSFLAASDGGCGVRKVCGILRFFLRARAALGP